MMKPLVVVVFSIAALLSHGGVFSTPFGCRACWDESSLTVENDLMTRSWKADGDVLRTTCFSLRGSEAGLLAPAVVTNASATDLHVSCRVERPSPVGEKSLVVTATLAGRTTSFRIFASVPGVIVAQGWTDSVPPQPSPKDYVQANAAAWSLIAAVRPRMDVLSFPHENLRLTEYTFRDQTDVHDTLMSVSTLYGRTTERPRHHFCTIMDAYDPVLRRGAVFLRLGPQPESRVADIPDFLVDANKMPIALVPVANGYSIAELLYSGSPDERIAVLQKLQRAFRPYRSWRDGVFLSNTWGGGNGDRRITVEFLRKEVCAGAEIGVDVIQVDDGWQHGRTTNSSLRKKGEKGVWNGYWAADPEFWQPARDRFPEGLAPLVDLAKGHGMRFGLWFGPDSSNDAANWERDADCLLGFYRSMGISYFKIDSLKLCSALGFSRCRKMFDKMLSESDGEMVFDLDATAEVRPGYFGMLDIGPVFVENRYAGRNYRPWATLASLWQLSHGIDPLRLRMEVVDPDPRRDKIDSSNPLAATNWPLDAGFAVAMFASPLAWMELSEVSPDRRAALRSIVNVWKNERDRLYAGTTFPVGARPDGFVWTGFVNRSHNEKGGYALLFRELSEEQTFSLSLGQWFAKTRMPGRAVVIAGRGTSEIQNGVLTVSVPAPLDFVFVKLE